MPRSSPPTTTRSHPPNGRVAELAASGMTNRDVAAALFISPKTVEANLARIYRKLGIKTRAELGRIIGTAANLVAVDHMLTSLRCHRRAATWLPRHDQP